MPVGTDTENPDASHLTAQHLPALNRLFRDLTRGLRIGLEQYRSGENGGRDGAVLSLHIIAHVLVGHKVIRDEGLLVPLIALANALDALAQNNILPLVRPPRRSGRAASSDLGSAIQAQAVCTVLRLQEFGVKPAAACELVAAVVKRTGLKPSRIGSPVADQVPSITGRTIRNWRERAAAGNADTLTAAVQMFSEKQIDLDHLSKEQAQEKLLENLGYVISIFRGRDL